jgi:hypothetical protein
MRNLLKQIAHNLMVRKIASGNFAGLLLRTCVSRCAAQWDCSGKPTGFA